MAIYELYSKRQRRAQNAGKEEVYQYDEVPAALRSQIRRIGKEAIGKSTAYVGGDYPSNPLAEHIHDVFCREVGIDHLGRGKDKYQDLFGALDTCDTEDFLDILELICRAISEIIPEVSSHDRNRWGIVGNSDDIIAEINYRLRESGLGFQYENKEIIRQDSKYLHDEVIKPALTLLNVKGFSGVQEEFLESHRCFRGGDYEQAIVEAAKAFESMMKAVCDQRGWDYSKGARASDLLRVLRANHFLPDYLDASFDQLAATLSSGLPKVRNVSGAHGQGPEPRNTPGFIAAYAIHLAAAKIVLLGEAAKS